MQFPRRCVAPGIYIVGIATFVDAIESSLNRIACETAPSWRHQRTRGAFNVPAAHFAVSSPTSSPIRPKRPLFGIDRSMGVRVGDGMCSLARLRWGGQADCCGLLSVGNLMLWS